MHKYLFLVFIIALLVTGVFSHEGHDHTADEHEHSGDDVVVLSDDNFEDTLESNEFVFVEFYAPWCGHCKQLAPAYEIVATSLKTEGSPVVIAKVDATLNPGVSTKYGVRGYPTLKFFRNGNPVDYEGGRSSNEIIDWLKKKSGPASKHITSAEEKAAFAEQPGSKLVAHVAESKVPNWVAVASTGKLEDFTFAHITDPTLFGDYSLDSVVILKLGEDSVVYSGAFDTDSLVNWALSEGYPLAEELAQKIWQRSSVAGTPLLALFVSALDDSNNALINALATKYKGKLLTSYSTATQLAERWGSSGKALPTAILVKWSEEQPEMVIFDEGTTFTLEVGEAFVDQALEGNYQSYRKSEPIPESNDGPVKIVVHKTFDELVLDPEKDVFVEFYAPWCGHCKNLAPVWEQLGESFEDVSTVTIAKFDATANWANPDLEIRGFPTLIFFPADNKGGIRFEGNRDLESLRKYVLEHASHTIDKEEL